MKNKTKLSHTKTVVGGEKSANFKLSWKVMLPFALVVGVAGTILLTRSFAQTPDYKYSAETCADKTSTSPESCIQKSAEAAVYRAYKGILKRNPDLGGYEHWKEQLTTGKSDYGGMVEYMARSREVSTDPSNLSTEDFVKLMYERILGYSPSAADINYWKGQIDSGTGTREWAVRHFAGVAKISDEQANIRLRLPNAKVFVGELYQNMFGYSGSDADVKYWVDRIYKDGWTQGKVARHFIVQTDAVKHHGSGAVEYIRTNMRPELPTDPGPVDPESGSTVDEIRKAQEARTEEAKKINQSTKKITEALKERSDDNANRQKIAKSIAERPEDKITRGDLSTIARNISDVIRARLNGYQGENYKQAIEKNYSKVQTLLVQAQAVTKQHPEITHNNLENEWLKADSYRKTVARHIANANWLLDETAKNYSTAEYKYELHLKHLQLEYACKQNGRVYRHPKCYANTPGGLIEMVLNSGGGLVCTISGRCNKPVSTPPSSYNPCAGVRHYSGRSAIAGCQRYLGVGADGIWGSVTEAAFARKFGYGSGYGGSSGGGGGSSGGNSDGGGGGSEAYCPGGYFRSGMSCWSNASSNPYCAHIRPLYVYRIGSGGSVCYYKHPTVGNLMARQQKASCSYGRTIRMEGSKAVCRERRNLSYR